MDYGYQTKLISKAYSLLRQDKKVVLAACPGAGKTVMAIKIVEEYLKKYPGANVLILTHGQMILRAQWAMNFKKFTQISPYEIKREIGEIKKIDSHVFLAIPQSVRRIKLYMKHIDLMIVDEAHHFYEGKGIGELIKTLNPKHQLLLTGTPSPYIDRDGYEVVGITIQELLPYETLTDPIIKIMTSEYELKLSDYGDNFDLKSTTHLDNKQTIDSFKKVMKSLYKKVGKSGKTMIVCHSQDQAKTIYQFFSRQTPCLISTSDLNDGNTVIEEFKSNPKWIFLIVVNRGILGFDYPELCNLIDMTQSLNVNRLFQMLCRVVRKYPNLPTREKLFLKICPRDLSKITYLVMSFTVSLSDPKYYFTYSQKTEDLFKSNRNFPIPKIVRDSFLDGDKSPTWNNNIPELLTFRQISDNSNSPLKEIAETDFKTVRALLKLDSRPFWTKESALMVASKYKTRNEFSDGPDGTAYQWLCKKGLSAELDHLFPRQRVNYDYRTVQELKDLISQYTTIKALRNIRLYDYLKRTKQLHLIPKDMPEWKHGDEPTKWNLKNSMELAKKYKDRQKFKAEANGAYVFLVENNSDILDKIIPRKKKDMSKEEFLKLVKIAQSIGVSAMCRKHKVKPCTFYARYARLKGARSYTQAFKTRDITERLKIVDHLIKTEKYHAKKACQEVGLSYQTYNYRKTKQKGYHEEA